MRIFKRGISAILIITILVLSIAGCSKSNETSIKSSGETGNKTNTAMGRYVETAVEMPADIGNDPIFQMEKSTDGYPVLYTGGGTKKGVFKYTMDRDGKWTKSSISWLENITVAGSDLSGIVMDNNKEMYYYYTDYVNDKPCPHLIKSDGKAISLEGWSDEKSKDKSISYIQLLKNGNLICSYEYSNNLVTYDKNTYKIIDSTTIENGSRFESILTPLGENYAFFTTIYNSSSSKLSIYDTENKLLSEIPLDAPEMHGGTSLYATADNSVVICNTDGIHLLAPEAKVWETVVDGALTSLSLPSIWNRSLIQGNDNTYYILYGADSSTKLMKYTYDKTVPTKPENELTIYSLSDNSIVRQAINVFQSNNPNVLVTLRVAMSKTDSAANKTDYIKALNTELLSGKGSDLILLDELPVASYIEKGGLLDISDVINPMLTSSELLPNIINSYKTNDKIYSVPTRFIIPTVFGKTEVVNASSTLDSLVEYSNSHNDTTLFGKLTYSDLLQQFLPIHLNTLLDKDGFFKRQELSEFLEKIKKLSDASGCVPAYKKDDDWSGKPGALDLADNVDIVIEKPLSITNSALILGMLDYIKGSFTPYENSFTAIGEIGINASTKQAELSKQFIKTLLSSEIQNEQLWDCGFPVNTKSLEIWRNYKDDGFQIGTQVNGKDKKPLIISAGYPKEEYIEKFIDICKKVSNKTTNDEILFNIIIEETAKFFDGNMTSETAADAIISRSRIYLSE